MLAGRSRTAAHMACPSLSLSASTHPTFPLHTLLPGFATTTGVVMLAGATCPNILESCSFPSLPFLNPSPHPFPCCQALPPPLASSCWLAPTAPTSLTRRFSGLAALTAPSLSTHPTSRAGSRSTGKRCSCCGGGGVGGRDLLGGQCRRGTGRGGEGIVGAIQVSGTCVPCGARGTHTSGCVCPMPCSSPSPAPGRVQAKHIMPKVYIPTCSSFSAFLPLGFQSAPGQDQVGQGGGVLQRTPGRTHARHVRYEGSGGQMQG